VGGEVAAMRTHTFQWIAGVDDSRDTSGYSKDRGKRPLGMTHVASPPGSKVRCSHVAHRRLTPSEAVRPGPWHDWGVEIAWLPWFV